jgi:hypothetical protein
VGDIISGEPQPIKLSRSGTFGLLYLLMSMQRSELVSKVRNSLGKQTTQVFSIESYSSFRPLSTVGPRFYWGNSSYLKQTSQLDLDYDKLIHQMDRSYPHKECFLTKQSLVFLKILWQDLVI